MSVTPLSGLPVAPSPLIISPAPFFDQLVLLSNNESNEERAEGTDWSWAAGQTIFSQHLTDNRNYDLTETDRKQKAKEGAGKEERTSKSWTKTRVSLQVITAEIH